MEPPRSWACRTETPMRCVDRGRSKAWKRGRRAGLAAAQCPRSFPKIGTARIGTLLFFVIKSRAVTTCKHGKARKFRPIGRTYHEAVGADPHRAGASDEINRGRVKRVDKRTAGRLAAAKNAASIAARESFADGDIADVDDGMTSWGHAFDGAAAQRLRVRSTFSQP
jgi:hypothetical protein